MPACASQRRLRRTHPSASLYIFVFARMPMSLSCGPGWTSHYSCSKRCFTVRSFLSFEYHRSSSRRNGKGKVCLKHGVYRHPHRIAPRPRPEAGLLPVPLEPPPRPGPVNPGRRKYLKDARDVSKSGGCHTSSGKTAHFVSVLYDLPPK